MRLVLLGDPVAHSRSPAMQEAGLRAAGLEGSYHARRVDAGGLETALAELRSGDLHGANVTMPHKALAARLVDRLDGPAARTGAVNTVVRQRGRAVGHNTDVDGVLRAWSRVGLPPHAQVLVLGTGGAAAAALVALEGMELLLTGRTPGAAEQLLQRLEVGGRPVSWGRPIAGAVVVNATPLGMAGEELPAGILEAAAGLLDMAYGEAETPAVRRCRESSVPVADGLEMLLGQGTASFELWTGRPAPEEAMRAALLA